MFSNLKNRFRSHFINLIGWRTDRKIVVFESDDWGMIRMASKKAYNWFLNKGYRVDQCPYNRNDAIESNEDLELLFGVLNSVNDRNGNPAVITANNVVANPDFEKIRDSNFSEYFYEPFTESLAKYPGRNRVIELYKKGIEQKLFYPQFHGREHLNVNRWMSELNTGNQELLDAFHYNMFTMDKSGSKSGRKKHLDAFGMGHGNEWVAVPEIIKSGLDLFEELWGFRSSSFIAPCYVWPPKIEEVLEKNGIKFIQGTHVQRVPISDSELKVKRKYHYLGQENSFGQRYLVRNVYFEPTENGRSEAVENAMREIEIAFINKKPAIVSSHRVNYIGNIRPENRDKNLKLLIELLQSIVKEYPEVEFMTSAELGSLIIGEV